MFHERGLGAYGGFACQVLVMSVEAVAILNAADRCDWCGARAFARALFNALSEGQKTAYLNMCGHHYRCAPMSLHEQAYHVIDETDRILED